MNLDFLQVYTWNIALAHLVLGIVLFFIINWIGARSVSIGYMQMNVVIQDDSAPAFNFLFKVLAPVVYLILCAVAFQLLGLDSFVDNCYFIVIDYWVFRLLWVLATGRGVLTNWVTQALYWICSIGLSLGLYSVLEKVDKILPDPKSLLDQMWILIIAFLYSVFNNIQSSKDGTIKRKNRYIRHRYAKFRARYDAVVHGFFHNNFYEALTYSIMIYEDFNRPYIVRQVENLKFRLSRASHTLGVMQVRTDRYIDDMESVILAVQKIARDSNMCLSQGIPEYCQDDCSYWIKNYILGQYNGGDYQYSEEVSEIFDYIVKQFYNGSIPKRYSRIPEKYVAPPPR